MKWLYLEKKYLEWGDPELERKKKSHFLFHEESKSMFIPTRQYLYKAHNMAFDTVKSKPCCGMWESENPICEILF